MKHIDLTLPTPQENLALDEALIDLCEGGREEEILRFWEPRESFVVLGHASRAAAEVNLSVCRAERIPVLRRVSGGGTVLQGPGCLNYALVLRNSGPLRDIAKTSAFVLDRHRQTLSQIIGCAVGIQGFSDLVLGELKFSGNAQYRRRRFLLFHGTFLLNLDLDLMERVLRVPEKQPAYRAARSHRNFVTNLGLPPSLIKAALRRAWRAEGWLSDVPLRRLEELVAARYSREEWNFRR